MSSLDHLYKSAVLAFPHTKKRQHVVHEIEIESMRWLPFLGMNTLLVRGEALNTENGNEYTPLVLFKKVNYNPTNNIVEITASDNNEIYHLERLPMATNALVRCSCGDYFWRAHYANWLDKSLYGANRKKYEALYNPGSANPTDSAMLCKHVMALKAAIEDSGILLPN